MINRNISVDEITEVVESAEVIADYDDDRPYPSKLLLKFVNGRPIHIVAAQNSATKECIIITCYEPDPDLWDQEFRNKIR